MAYDFTSWQEDMFGNDPNSLAHYGVLGMKWGIRRYQNADGSLTAAGQRHYEKTGEKGYHYHSHATKKYQRKAAKAEAKGKTEKAKKYANRAKRSAEIDKGEEEYARRLGTGKAIIGALTGNSDRMKGYAQYRAMAKQSGRQFTGKKAVAGALGIAKGSVGSRQRKAAYIRQDEGGKGLGQKVYKFNEKIGERAAASIQRDYDYYVGGKKHRRK